MQSKGPTWNSTELKRAVQENLRNRYIPYHLAFYNYFKNWGKNYETYTLETVKRCMTSDTVFIVGAGPSLNRLSRRHFEVIAQHDSFAINYAFLKKEIRPTYLQLSLEKDWSLQYMVRALEHGREQVRDSIFFLHSKALHRMAHPRLTPELFASNPQCCIYKLPEPIQLEKARPFAKNDFDKTVFYRGTLTLTLDLVLRMGYRKIVLLGIDPDQLAYFFDEYSFMQEFCERLYGSWKARGIETHESMAPKGAKYHTIDTYLGALNKYLLEESRAELFMGLKGGLPRAELPIFFDSL